MTLEDIHNGLAIVLLAAALIAGAATVIHRRRSR